MLCSSIKLTDRREFGQDKTPKRNRFTMLEEKLFMKSDYYHSYTFRWDKPKRRYYSCDNSQFLSVQDLIFPEHLSQLNEPPSKEWLKKRPRPKTSDIFPDFHTTIRDDDGLSICALTEQFSRETQELIEDIKSGATVEEEEDKEEKDEEIDPDIQQLILSTRDSEIQKELIEEDKKSQKKRKKHKKKCCDDKELIKNKTKTTIKFYLSKPPTPQTLEVIRVDVTSNFSMEEELPDTNRTESSISDCSKGCGMKILKNKQLKDRLHRKMAQEMELSDNEVNVMCRRLILKERS